MKFGFISTVHGYQWPGSEYMWADAASALINLGHEVACYVSADFKNAEKLQQLTKAGAKVHFIPAPRTRIQRWKNKLINPYRTISATKPDKLVISCGSLLDIAYNPSLYEFLIHTNIPCCIINQFNAETFWIDTTQRRMMRAIYEKAAASIFISDLNLEIAERQLCTHFKQTRILTNPVWVKLDNPLPWPDEQTWQFACVARLDVRWKGQDVLLKVLSSPTWKSRNWILNFYGEGTEEDYIRDLVKFYGLEQKVAFKGFEKDLKKVWQDNHLQVLPTKAEGGPMVITEGMLCGRPAVTTYVGHIPEFIDEGKNGFMADFATPESYSKAMERAWLQKDHWQEMGLAAHETIKHQKRYDTGQRVAEFLLEF